MRTAEFILYFDRGISDYDSWLAVMKEHKLVKTSGSWYTYTDPDTSKEIKFLSKDFAEKLDNDSELKEKIYNLICDKSILKYQSNKLGLDDIVETDEEIDAL